jgi:hypothetical protein
MSFSVDRRGWYKTRAGRLALVETLVDMPPLSCGGKIYVPHKLTDLNLGYWSNGYWRPDGCRDLDGREMLEDLVAYWEGPSPDLGNLGVPYKAPPIGPPGPEPPAPEPWLPTGSLVNPGDVLYRYVGGGEQGRLELEEVVFVRGYTAEEAEKETGFGGGGYDCYVLTSESKLALDDPRVFAARFCARLAKLGRTPSMAIRLRLDELQLARFVAVEKERAKGLKADQARIAHLRSRVQLRLAETDLAQAEKDLAAHYNTERIP